jgi:virginiamycin B lyase
VTPAGVTTAFPTPSPGSRPVGIVAGPDGNLWVGEGRLPYIARVTPAGEITEIPVPYNGVIWVVVGPDQNIWFTFTSDNSLAYVTPSPP